MSALYYDCLLGLPETSDAFSSHPKIANAHKNKGPQKSSPSIHPRKTPRLARDADSASASRSRGAGAALESGSMSGTVRGDGDVSMRDAMDEGAVVSAVLRVEGAPCTFPPAHYPSLSRRLPFSRQARAARWPIHLRMPQSHYQVPQILPRKTSDSWSGTHHAPEFLVREYFRGMSRDCVLHERFGRLVRPSEDAAREVRWGVGPGPG